MLKQIKRKTENGFLMVGTILSLVIFAGILLMVDTYYTHALQRTALKQAEMESAQQAVQFSVAANSCVNTGNTNCTGPSVTLQDLLNAGYLYSSFNSENPVGQSLTAYVGGVNAQANGQKMVIVYYTGNPVLGKYYFGTPSGSQGAQAFSTAFEMAVATDVAKMQQTSPAYVSGVVNSNGTKFLLPYSTSTFAISGDYPGLNTGASKSAPTFANVINTLPYA